MTKKFKIEITQEAIDYVQRIGYEVDGYTHIINSLFEQHKNDIDDSVIKALTLSDLYAFISFTEK